MTTLLKREKREFETFTEPQAKQVKLKFKRVLVVTTTLSQYLQPVPTQNITSLTTQILSRNKGQAHIAIIRFAIQSFYLA